MTVERIFDELGHFKRFQACLYFAAAFQAVACGIHYLASVFLVETPNFACGVPANVTDVLLGNLSGSRLEDFLPLFKADSSPLVVRTAGGEQWELSRCTRALRVRPQDFTYAFDGNTSVQSCRDGTFVYDRRQVYQSVVTDWDLVCSRAWLAKLCQPTFMLGVLIGALVFGDIADRVGRVKILMLTSVCQFGLGVCVAFSANYYYFVVLRFFLAMVSSGYLVVVFVYVTEFTGIKVRTWTSMHVHAAFAVGIMVVALTGYLVRVWWIYQIVLSLCTSPFLLFCWKFPETPFYLLAKGEHQRAQDLLDRMARVNRLDRRLKVEELLQAEEHNGAPLLHKEAAPAAEEKKKKKLSILDLFGSWRMARRTGTVWAIWFIGSLGYYVFSLGSVNLGGNRYLNLFLVGAVELPSYLVGCFCMDRIGRKKTCAPALLLAGVACVLIIVVPADMEALTIALSMMGKFAIAIAFGLIYLYTCELYPTIIRSLAVGSGSMMCRVGSVVAPFCVYLADVWIHLPQLIVGILAFVIGILTLLLPETLGQPLTSTLEEAEALGRSPPRAAHGQEMKRHASA
ncbi:solute carrier family 22 member 16 [Vanacampus margaritifer]